MQFFGSSLPPKKHSTKYVLVEGFEESGGGPLGALVVLMLGHFKPMLGHLVAMLGCCWATNVRFFWV